MKKPLLQGTFEIVDRCKFCGCCEALPCQIPIDIDGNFLAIADPKRTVGFLSCGWLIENSVCTAPSCVAKAYLEAWPLADEIGEIAA